MRILETDRDPIDEVLAALSAESAAPDAKLQDSVRKIIADVKVRGDEALLELGKIVDTPNLTNLQVTEAELEDAYKKVTPEFLTAIRKAKSNIEAFHKRQMQNSWMDANEDFTYGQIIRPLETVGIHAPAQLAPLASTVLMTAIPANVAGVKQIVLCMPPQADGNASAPMLVAAKECGVTNIFKTGGALAAAAMAFGTKSIPRVDKIVGPGNAYLVEAKRQLFGIVGIDQLAGPSEILILADDTANPACIAADILSQAEHAPDSRCVLVTTSRKLADAALKEIKRQTDLAERKDYITESLDKFGVVIIARDLDECISLSNAFAPEHLEIALAQPWEVMGKIKNAGTIMVGHYTPVPLCDFAAGPNHTLPTGGTARFSSALSVDDFIKKSGLLSYSKKALESIAPTVFEMANAEGLPAHANTVRIRVSEDN